MPTGPELAVRFRGYDGEEEAEAPGEIGTMRALAEAGYLA
jgi:hypothetical protein